MTLVSVTAYHSFSGEVEASNTPTIRRLTPSCRHQLPRIARWSIRHFHRARLLGGVNTVLHCHGHDQLPANRTGAFYRNTARLTAGLPPSTQFCADRDGCRPVVEVAA